MTTAAGPSEACPTCAGKGLVWEEYVEPARSEIRLRSLTCDDCGGGGCADHYTATTDGPVRYYRVSRLAGVVGYLWAAEDDTAAGFIRKIPGSDPYPHPGYACWRRRLSDDKARGRTPLQMLRGWVGVPRDPSAGGIPEDATEQTAESLAALEQLAAAPETYRPVARTTVHYLPVALQGSVIGYLWASDAERAAGFVSRPGTGAIGIQATTWWESRLEEAYATGHPPLAAILGWTGAREVPMAGQVPPDAVAAEAADSEAVFRLAGVRANA